MSLTGGLPVEGIRQLDRPQARIRRSVTVGSAVIYARSADQNPVASILVHTPPTVSEELGARSRLAATRGAGLLCHGHIVRSASTQAERKPPRPLHRAGSRRLRGFSAIRLIPTPLLGTQGHRTGTPGPRPRCFRHTGGSPCVPTPTSPQPRAPEAIRQSRCRLRPIEPVRMGFPGAGPPDDQNDDADERDQGDENPPARAVRVVHGAARTVA